MNRTKDDYQTKGLFIPTENLIPLSEITDEDKREFEKEFNCMGFSIEKFTVEEGTCFAFGIKTTFVGQQETTRRSKGDCTVKEILWLAQKYDVGQGEKV